MKTGYTVLNGPRKYPSQFWTGVYCLQLKVLVLTVSDHSDVSVKPKINSKNLHLVANITNNYD